MNSTRLFIENTEVELNDSVRFAITRQFEDINNPTTIINSWSKTISIPFTQKNNALFGYIFDPNRITRGFSGGIGIGFDPYRKLKFRLEWNGDVLMQGYAKLNEIHKYNDTGSYEVTLFGELGKVLSEMKKITFDESTEDTAYLIDGSQYVDEYIDRTLVYNSWTSSGQTTASLLKKTDSGYNVTDIIGFAPNNSFSDGFDYKTFQTSLNDSASFSTALGDSFKTDTGIEANTAIPDGVLPREIGEYRSYLQLPFIYWNKLFRIFQAKAEVVTGYTFDLDTSWFSPLNPYWYNLVYMLRGFDAKKMISIENTPHAVSSNSSTQRYELQIPVSSGYFYEPNTRTPLSYNFELDQDSNFFDTSTGYFTIPEDTHFKLNGSLISRWYFRDRNGYLSTGAKARIEADCALVNVIKFYDTNNNLLYTRTIGMANDTTNVPGDRYDELHTLGELSFGQTYLDVIAPLNLVVTQEDIHTDTFKVVVESYVDYMNPTYISGKQPPFRFWVYGEEETVGTLEVRYYTTENMININSLSAENGFRSGDNFTLNRLWNNEYNVFDEVLRYCKMYRIGIFVDDINKVVRFIPFTRYFRNYTITDWTDKLDLNRDYTIKPIAFDSKYVLFNYDDNETQLGKEYLDKYGMNYGDYRLITKYNFDNETKNLFEGCKANITYTDNVLSWTNLYDNHRIVYSFPDEIYAYCKDEDNKFVDIFGTFFFHKGLKDFSTEAALNMRPVRITDDTKLQAGSNTFFYSQGYNFTRVTTYPFLDIVYNNGMCTFNVPKENYTYLQNYAGKNCIYNIIWRNFINERYSSQNKVVTCYLHLHPMDYIDFEFNHFIRINNQVYMVNKIYDYDVASNESTKVDLITVQDITGYTS